MIISAWSLSHKIFEFDPSTSSTQNFSGNIVFKTSAPIDGCGKCTVRSAGDGSKAIAGCIDAISTNLVLDRKFLFYIFYELIPPMGVSLDSAMLTINISLFILFSHAGDSA